MKLSKKWKYLLFSSLGIISIGVVAITTPLTVLKQNSNNNISSTSNVVDATTSNKLASFSTKWKVKTKEQQTVQDQFNQFLNFDGNNESSNTKDVTLLISNQNSIKNKQLMTKISKGLKKLSVSQQNQIKNGMLTMHNLTKNNPITEKNIDSIYGHFISQDKINQIKEQVKEIQSESKKSINNKEKVNNLSLFYYAQNPTVSEEISNLETASLTVGGVAVIASVISVLMWFCDWFGITTYAAISASCVAAALGIAAVGLGIQTSLIKSKTEGYLNDNLMFIVRSSLMSAPLVSAFKDIALIMTGLTTVTDSFGWIVPAVFTLTAITSWILCICAMVTNN